MHTRRGNTMHKVGSESLTDVLSNTVGVLVLLCINGVFESGQVRWPVEATDFRMEGLLPISRDMEAGMIVPSVFGEEGFDLLATEERRVETRQHSYVVSNGQIRSLRALQEKLLGFRSGKDAIIADSDFPFHGTAEFVDQTDECLIAKIKIQLKESVEFPGDPIERFLSGTGQVFEEMDKLDPDENHVFLFLAMDSFGHYLFLRDRIMGLGLKVGWWITGPEEIDFFPEEVYHEFMLMRSVSSIVD